MDIPFTVILGDSYPTMAIAGKAKDRNMKSQVQQDTKSTQELELIHQIPN